MNFSGKFDAGAFVASVSMPDATHHAETVTLTPSASNAQHAIIVPDAVLLFSGDYKRAGNDLILSHEDRSFTVHDYFRNDKHGTLASPEGATLSAAVVDAMTGYVTYAQASPGAVDDKPIGHVVNVSGSATVIRNGVAVELHAGDNVFKSDVVQSGSDSSVGITFIDGTAFGLQSNARMVLNEMVYDPNGSSNSALISLVQGTFSFVAGQAAKNGGMKIDTPVATMGIRGTAGVVEIGIDNGPSKFILSVEPGGHAGSYDLIDKITGAIVATVSQAGQVTFISPNASGLPTVLSRDLTPQEQAADRDIIQNVFKLYFPQYNQDDSNPGAHGASGSSINPLNQSLPAGNTTLPPGTPGTLSVTVTTTNPDGTTTTTTLTYVDVPPTITTTDNTGVQAGGITNVEVTQSDAPGDKTFLIADHVKIVLDNISTDIFHDVPIPYVPNTAKIDPAANGAVGPASLPPGFDLRSLVHIDPATGTVTYDPYNFRFLGEGEKAVYIIEFQSGAGPFVLDKQITLTINGLDDAPIFDATNTPLGLTETADTTNSSSPISIDAILPFHDADFSDVAAGYTVQTTGVTTSGHTVALPNDTTLLSFLHFDSISKAIGTDVGSIKETFSAPDKTFDYLATGETVTITYTILVTDAEGGSGTQTVSFTITGTNDAPVLTADVSGAGPSFNLHAITEQAGVTNDVVTAGGTTAGPDTTNGTLAFTDVDLTDTHTVSQSAPNYVWSGGSLASTQMAALTAAATLALTLSDSTGTGHGSVAFNYSVDDKALDFLAAGETLTITYNVTVADYHDGVANGTTSAEPVTITITGTNDAAVIGDPSSASVTDNTNVDDNGNLVATGSISVVDPDHDQSSFLTAVSVAAGDLGTLSLNADGTYTYTVANSAVEYLADGETKVDTFTVTSLDGTTKDVSFTINGTNEAPVISQSVLFSSGVINTNGTYTPHVGGNGSTLQLTNTNGSEATSWFDNQKISVTSFHASFDYQAIAGDTPTADGVVFILQNSAAGPHALGGDGSDLGYGGDGFTATAITPSAAIELNIYDGHIQGTNFAIDGADGNTQNYNSTIPVDFWDTGDTIKVDLVYDGSVLTETLTDLVTNNTYSASYTVDLAGVLGSDSAYIGFSGATGAFYANQTISDFDFEQTVNYTATPVAIDPTLTLSDVDSAAFASATVQITGNLHSSEDILAFVNTDANEFGNIAASYVAATGLLTLTSEDATATVAQWQNALQAVTYSNVSDNPSAGVRTISYQVDDGASHNHLSNTETVSLNVLNTEAPTVTISVVTPDGMDFHAHNALSDMGSGTVQPGTDVTFTITGTSENHVFVVDGIDFTYVDGQVTGGTITSFHEFAANGTTALADFTGLSVDADAWMTDVRDAADGNTTAIDALTSTFSYIFNGGAGDDTFGSAGHADTLIGGGGSDTLNPGGASSGSHDTVTGGAGSDTFVYQAGYGAVTITDFDQGNGTFSQSEGDLIELSGFTGKPIVTQVGADTVADFGNGDVLTLLNVDHTQLNDSDFIGGGGGDGEGSNGLVISNADNTITYAGTPVFLDQTIAVSDTDPTATVTEVNAWISSGAQTGDVLSINGTENGDTPTDGDLTYSDGTIHYHFDGNSMSLTATAGVLSLTDFDTALQSIQFSPGDADGARTVTWAAHDSTGATSPTVTTTVNVGPILNSFNFTVSGDGGIQGGSFTYLSDANFNVTHAQGTDFFSLQDVTGGVFEVTSDGTHWVTALTGGFSIADIETNHVRFHQFGSATVPDFSIWLSDGSNVSPAIAPDVTLDIRTGANSRTISFGGDTGTLLLEDPSHFGGKIAGITGSGDVLDFRGIDAANDTVTATTGPGSFNSSTNTTTLTVTDHTDNAKSVSIALTGDYSQSNWTITPDGHGGVNIVDPPGSSQSIDGVVMHDPGPLASNTIIASASDQTLVGTNASDAFVFNFIDLGHDTVTGFNPTTDALQFAGSIFVTAQAALNATQDDGQGNTIVTLDAHDTITLSGVLKAQLQVNDFHVV